MSLKDSWRKRPQGTLQSAPAPPVGVAALMPSHSKTPYNTPSMDFYSRKGVVGGRRGPQLKLTLHIARTNKVTSCDAMSSYVKLCQDTSSHANPRQSMSGQAKPRCALPTEGAWREAALEAELEAALEAGFEVNL